MKLYNIEYHYFKHPSLSIDILPATLPTPPTQLTQSKEFNSPTLSELISKKLERIQNDVERVNSEINCVERELNFLNLANQNSAESIEKVKKKIDPPD